VFFINFALRAEDKIIEAATLPRRFVFLRTLREGFFHHILDGAEPLAAKIVREPRELLSFDVVAIGIDDKPAQNLRGLIRRRLGNRRPDRGIIARLVVVGRRLLGRRRCFLAPGVSARVVCLSVGFRLRLEALALALGFHRTASDNTRN
jgi:hypothetical protein